MEDGPRPKEEEEGLGPTGELEASESKEEKSPRPIGQSDSRPRAHSPGLEHGCNPELNSLTRRHLDLARRFS